MPSELFLDLKGRPRVDLDLVYPPFYSRVFVALAAAKVRGAIYFAQRGTATFEEQGNLHALYLAGKGGRAAPAGESIHNFGGGLDFTHDEKPDVPGLQPDWIPEHYRILREEVERVGLVSGASFGDWPHVQWPGFVTAAQLAPLRRIYQATEGDVRARLVAVWRYLDAHSPALPALHGPLSA